MPARRWRRVRGLTSTSRSWRAPRRRRLERGTIKATILIETIPAAFEMDEILYALKENIVGLNCGRWDYIFSTIKRLGRSADRLTPDRSAMTMDKAFLAAYSLRLIETCHRRGRSEEHTSELQSRRDLVCRLLL